MKTNGDWVMMSVKVLHGGREYVKEFGNRLISLNSVKMTMSIKMIFNLDFSILACRINTVNIL